MVLLHRDDGQLAGLVSTKWVQIRRSGYIVGTEKTRKNAGSIYIVSTVPTNNIYIIYIEFFVNENRYSISYIYLTLLSLEYIYTLYMQISGYSGYNRPLTRMNPHVYAYPLVKNTWVQSVSVPTIHGLEVA